MALHLHSDMEIHLGLYSGPSLLSDEDEFYDFVESVDDRLTFLMNSGRLPGATAINVFGKRATRTNLASLEIGVSHEPAIEPTKLRRLVCDINVALQLFRRDAQFTSRISTFEDEAN